MVDNIGAAAIRFTPNKVTERNGIRQSGQTRWHASSPSRWPYPHGSSTEEIESEPMHYEHSKDGGRMVRRINALLIAAFVVICLLSEAAGAQQQQVKDQPMPTEKNTLIVYLSRTNNTRAIAEIIHQEVGGRLVSLELQTPYPENYTATVQQVVHENETGYLPPLKTKLDHVEQYDYVFVGFPTWGMQLPPPVKSFLQQYDFKGKTVIPFNTNAGYGSGNSFQTVMELCPRSTVLQGFSTLGGIERDGQYLVIQGARTVQARQEVDNRLKTIGMLK